MQSLASQGWKLRDQWSKLTSQIDSCQTDIREQLAQGQSYLPLNDARRAGTEDITAAVKSVWSLGDQAYKVQTSMNTDVSQSMARIRKQHGMEQKRLNGLRNERRKQWKTDQSGAA